MSLVVKQGRRQTAVKDCEPRASATAGSRAGSFRVLAGPGTTAGRSLVSRASSLASSLLLCCGTLLETGRSRRTWACLAGRRPRTCRRSPTAAGLGLRVLAGRRVACWTSAGPGVSPSCRARLGFAVLSVRAALAVQRSRSDWRAVSGYRCDSRPRAVSQTAIYAWKRCKHADFCASLAIKLAVRH